MATSATEYSPWAVNGSVGTYRLKINLSDVTEGDKLDNKSVARVQVWIQSKAPASFSISTSRRCILDGTTRLDSSATVTCASGGETRFADYKVTVTHNSTGERTVTASARLSNSYAGTHDVSVSLRLNRIPQLPDAPSAAPTVARSGSTLTVTSAPADGNGSTILDYMIAWRLNGGSWSYPTGRTISLTGVPGGVYTFQSRARTSRGWGPYSTARTYTMPADTSGVANLVAALAPGTVSCSWDPPATGTPVSYEAQLYTGGAWGSTVANTERSASWSSLPTGTYQVRARALYASTQSPWEESEPAYLGTVPGAIAAVTLVAEGNATWSEPSTGGTPITAYDVQWWDGSAWGPTIESQRPGSWYEAEPLPGIGYRCRARAVNAVGPGPWTTSPYRCLADCPCTI